MVYVTIFSFVWKSLKKIDMNPRLRIILMSKDVNHNQPLHFGFIEELSTVDNIHISLEALPKRILPSDLFRAKAISLHLGYRQ